MSRSKVKINTPLHLHVQYLYILGHKLNKVLKCSIFQYLFDNSCTCVCACVPVEASCPVPPNFPLSTILLFTLQPETLVTYECVNDSFLFEDGSKRKSFVCENFVWNDTFVDCARTYKKERKKNALRVVKNKLGGKINISRF